MTNGYADGENNTEHSNSPLKTACWHLLSQKCSQREATTETQQNNMTFLQHVHKTIPGAVFSTQHYQTPLFWGNTAALLWRESLQNHLGRGYAAPTALTLPRLECITILLCFPTFFQLFAEPFHGMFRTISWMILTSDIRTKLTATGRARSAKYLHHFAYFFLVITLLRHGTLLGCSRTAQANPDCTTVVSHSNWRSPFCGTQHDAWLTRFPTPAHTRTQFTSESLQRM